MMEILETEDSMATEMLDIVKENRKTNMIVAEVGVAEGYTTEKIIKIIKEENGFLYAIDWFKGNTEFPYPNEFHGYNESEEVHEERYKHFYKRIRKLFSSDKEMKKYVKILRGDSTDMAKFIEDESLDICYIDAGHSYEAVKKDIEIYLPKIKIGGIISGHDYNDVHSDVVAAVNEKFANSVKVLNNPNRQGQSGNASWVVIK